MRVSQQSATRGAGRGPHWVPVVLSLASVFVLIGLPLMLFG